MKPGSTTTTTENAIFERLYLNALLGVDRIDLFVNSDTGADAGNNGSAGAPYATIPRALADLPLLNLAGSKVFIYCEGVAPFLLPDGFVFPQINNPGRIEADLAQPELFAVQGFGAVNLVGVCTPQLVLQAGDVVAQNQDITSGLLTIVTNLALVPNAFDRLFLVDGIGSIAAVQFNTATDIKAVFASVMNFPITIYSRPTIQNEVAGSLNPTIRCRDLGGELVIAGLDIGGGIAGFGPSVAVFNSTVQFYGTRLRGGLWGGFDIASTSISTAGITSLGGVYESLIWSLGGSMVLDGYFPGVDFSITGSLFSVIVTAGAFDEGTPPFYGLFFFGASPQTLRLQNCELFKNDGVRYSSENIVLSQVKIDDSNNDGVLIESNGYALLQLVAGAGNAGLGVKASDGAHVQVDASTFVTGFGGDLQSGANLVNTWAAFHVAKNDIDVTVELTRIWEP